MSPAKVYSPGFRRLRQPQQRRPQGRVGVVELQQEWALVDRRRHPDSANWDDDLRASCPAGWNRARPSLRVTCQ